VLFLRFNDLSGQHFGELKVLYPSDNKHPTSTNKLFVCECKCGNIVEVLSNHLIGKNNTSCGHCNQVSYTHYTDFVIGRDKKGNFFIIDNIDYERVSKYYWMMSPNGRWYANIDKKSTSLHQFIIGTTPEGLQIDHKNRHPKDCRKENLRFATPSQNNHNKGKMNGNYTSQYKGVGWDKSRNRWLANIRVNGRLIGLGTHKEEIDAAIAYNKKAFELFGELAVLNKVV